MYIYLIYIVNSLSISFNVGAPSSEFTKMSKHLAANSSNKNLPHSIQSKLAKVSEFSVLFTSQSETTSFLQETSLKKHEAQIRQKL